MQPWNVTDAFRHVSMINIKESENGLRRDSFFLPIQGWIRVMETVSKDSLCVTYSVYMNFMSCRPASCWHVSPLPFGLMRSVPVWLIAFIISPLCPLSHISNFPINPGHARNLNCTIIRLSHEFPPFD